MKYIYIYKKYGVCRTSSVYNFIEREPVVFVVIKKPPVCSCSPPLWKLRSTHTHTLILFICVSFASHLPHYGSRAHGGVPYGRKTRGSKTASSSYSFAQVSIILMHSSSAKQTTKFWGTALCFLSWVFTFNSSPGSLQLDRVLIYIFEFVWSSSHIICF